MIKILIINSTLEQSGLTNVIYNICKFIDKNKFKISILTLSKEPENSSWLEFKNLGIELFSLKLNRIEGIILTKWKLREITAKINPDMIQTFSFRGTLFAFKYLRLYKRSATIQANLKDNHTGVYGNLLGAYFAFRELKAFKHADLKFVCSRTLFSYYQYIPDINVICNGADDQKYFDVSMSEKARLRLKLNLPADQKIFISAGLLEERKDPLTVIKAFIRANVKNAVLIVLGSGSLAKTSKLLSGSNSVFFRGSVNNVNEYFQASDVYISASISEGLPNSVIEAALCGLPCFLSDIPQHREIFSPDSKQAIFFHTRDYSALSDLLKTEWKSDSFDKIILNAKNMTVQYESSYQSFLKLY